MRMTDEAAFGDQGFLAFGRPLPVFRRRSDKFVIMLMTDEAAFGDQGFFALDRDERSAQAVRRRRDVFHVIFFKRHPLINPPV